MPITLGEYNKRFSACHWSEWSEILVALEAGAWLEGGCAYDEHNWQYELCFVDGRRNVTVLNHQRDYLDQFVQKSKEESMPKLIGLSVSFCIQDIATGKVAYEDVEFIVGGTKAATTKAWGRVFDHYCEVFWKGIEVKAMEILQRLVKENKIYQPRLMHNYLAPKGTTKWIDYWELDVMLPYYPYGE